VSENEVLQNATVPVLTNDELLERVDADLTDEVQQALQLLRDKGFSVAAFTPTELRGADPDRIEDAMVQMGWDAIDSIATEPRPDEGEVAQESTPPVCAIAYHQDGTEYDRCLTWETGQTLANEGYLVVAVADDGQKSMGDMQAIFDYELKIALDCFGKGHRK
jgi:hypothetical protein